MKPRTKPTDTSKRDALITERRAKYLAGPVLDPATKRRDFSR